MTPGANRPSAVVAPPQNAPCNAQACPGNDDQDQSPSLAWAVRYGQRRHYPEGLGLWMSLFDRTNAQPTFGQHLAST
jgi:hypothetical protein